MVFANAMDADVGRWLLEFLLRSSVPESLLKKIIMLLPISGSDSRLRKTLLLRAIQSQVSKASLPETLLENLETIEELDRSDGIAITATMKQAYCAVAVECTVKYLKVCPDNNNYLYLDVVKRIWRGRVRAMETASGEGSELFTGELIKWRDEIEAAVWDSEVCKRLANMNTRRIALNKIKDFLAEACAVMGPSFAELATLSEVKGLHSCWGNTVGDARKEVATGRPDEGRNIAEPMIMYEGRLQSSTNTREGFIADDRIELDNNGAICTEEAPVIGGNQDSEQLEKRAVSLVDGSRELGGTDSPPRGVREIQKGTLPLKRKHTASCRLHRRVKIIDAEEVGPETMCSKYDPVPSAEVNKVRESLRSSSLELQALVKDPLPDTIHKSDIVRSELAMKGISHEPPLENQSRDVDVPDPHACKSIVLYQPNDHILRKRPSVLSSNVPRPNLMERNSTAHTYEWNDSINNSPDGTLKQRRRAKKWSSLEEETLRTGVERFGKGNWKTILNFYSEIFKIAERTDVDLKDKWRNMTR